MVQGIPGGGSELPGSVGAADCGSEAGLEEAVKIAGEITGRNGSAGREISGKSQENPREPPEKVGTSRGVRWLPASAYLGT